MTNRIYPYQWHTSKNTEENYVRVFGLDKENKSICLTITDFYPYIYVELPSEIKWTESAILSLSSKIQEKSGKCQPVSRECVMRKKLYYANVDDKCKPKKFPFFKLSFYNLSERNLFMAKLRRPFTISEVR